MAVVVRQLLCSGLVLPVSLSAVLDVQIGVPAQLHKAAKCPTSGVLVTDRQC